ncbi:MAG TPA: alpha/beta fold hydrolase [Acidimicrobiales bacterium]|nr:alpha/beta fold hydrolase [Acidimicrobiales bacterium]
MSVLGTAHPEGAQDSGSRRALSSAPASGSASHGSVDHDGSLPAAAGTPAWKALAGRLVSRLAATAGGPLAPVLSLFESRPYEVGTFEVGALRLHYESHGHGPKNLVFLHGLLLDAQMNRRLAADLAAAGHRVVLLDLPGHGHSDKPRHASAHRMDSYAHYVVALLDHLGIEQAVVGGVSLGANVALQVAVQAPSRVRGLVVEMPVLEWAVPGAAMVFLPMLLGVHYAAPVIRLVAAVARRVPHTKIAPLDSFVSVLTAEPDEAAAVLHGMLVGPITPTYEDRQAITAPALVIGHKVDFIHPFTDADHLARQLPHARLVQAHSIVELRVAPERLTGEISAFLDRVWTTPGAPVAQLA